MTKYRVTAALRNGGKRVATSQYWNTSSEAHGYAIVTNGLYPGARARVVIDSPKIREMIP